MKTDVDVLIAGGGLAGSLTALKLSLAHPDLKILLLEEKDCLGGLHTWSFHETDLSSEAREWIEPLVTRTWSKHSVKFPKFERIMNSAYMAIRSEDLHRVVSEKLGASVLLNSRVIELTSSTAVLEGGRAFSAKCVMDARGQSTLPNDRTAGFQKFIGLDLELESPHGLQDPVIMDATCPQLDGFRFFYLLPWSDTRLLLEETFYSDTPDLNHERIVRSIKSYAERRGWKIRRVLREEKGVLPIPMISNYISHSVESEPVPIGVRAGLFHATTGYSLPDALKVASAIAASPELTTSSVRQCLVKLKKPWLSRQKFYRTLNRLLFLASEPALRYAVLQKFYEHSDDVIDRFYGGQTSWTDRFRILSGAPPVSVKKALRSWSEKSVHEQFGGDE